MIRKWIGVSRQKVIARANVDKDLSHPVASVVHNKLNSLKLCGSYVNSVSSNMTYAAIFCRSNLVHNVAMKLEQQATIELNGDSL